MRRVGQHDGVGGCGNLDDDSDGDGTVDCQDSCPDDVDKVDPGICGCDVPDADGDAFLVAQLALQADQEAQQGGKTELREELDEVVLRHMLQVPVKYRGAEGEKWCVRPGRRDR